MLAITTIIAALALAANQAFAAPTEISQLVARQGYVANCNKTYSVVSGDTCNAIIGKLGNTFTLEQFYSWNPQVASDCHNLYPGETVCVGLAPAQPACPAPTQPGLVSNCVACYKVVEGDYCYAIAQAKGITVANFLLWNPSVNSACTNLVIGYNYCVGV
ncbi:carbohydrate-binding module family 50 protein [Annulohypoxylon maeteangense]|uniref:carbohydrate-binding module family 50 protein n=1 Tax=Annulohypoxylon maeteangense TaxID=1927788 RepID=UPI002008426C|nr:carbohydrate-binding module family 50 protein [Annulohypoxylon maeteangense]KAI0882797.1 carbohydrate-binding module family 50 protein [Annulohypoxylon maeteangense]